MSSTASEKPLVAFHFNAPDKLAYACRFLRKARRHEIRVTVVAPLALLQALSPKLWRLGPQEFLAHSLPGDDPLVIAQSPIALVEQAQASPHRQLLLNLSQQVPPGFEAFERVVEVVSSDDPQDKQAARERWRHYAALGHEIERHDLVLKG